MRARRLLPVLGLVLLVLTGCTAEAREDLVDRVQDLVDGGEPSPDATPAATEEPTAQPSDEATATPTETPTEQQTVTPSPSPTPTEEPAPAEETAPPDDGQDEASGAVAGLPWWVAVVLAFLFLLLLGLLRRRRRRRARRARLRDAVLSEADWLLARAQERPVRVDAAARARDVRLRWDRLEERLTELRGAARPPAAELSDDLRTSMRQLTEAVITRLDDVATTGAASATLGVDELAQRARVDRDALARKLGRRPDRT